MNNSCAEIVFQCGIYSIECQLFILEQLKLEPQTYIYIYIYRIVSPGECHEHIYMVTPFSVFKKAKIGTFARNKNCMSIWTQPFLNK